MEEDVPLLNRRQAVRIIVVAVGCIDDKVSLGQDGIRGHDGKFEDHLIDFAVAVAADAEDGVFYSIQHGKDFFRIIVFRQIVSRSVVEDVAEENETVGTFPLISFEETAAVVSRAVNI